MSTQYNFLKIYFPISSPNEELNPGNSLTREKKSLSFFYSILTNNI